MFDFNKPKIEIAEISEDKKYGRFVVEPLERGYGTTLGNSFRRQEVPKICCGTSGKRLWYHPGQFSSQNYAVLPSGRGCQPG